MSTKRISAFDLDHTLINVNCAFRFGVYLCKKRHRSIWSLLLLFVAYGLLTAKILSIKHVHKLAFRCLFKGLNASDVHGWVEDCLRETSTKDYLYSPAILKLKEAKEAGHLTLILSSSPSFLVHPIAKLFNVDLAYATTYDMDASGKYSGISEIVLGDDKARYIQEICKRDGVEVDKVVTYSDSYADLPFLKAGGTAVGVNPDYFLKRACRKNNWNVI